jgi:hypothetical protein
MSSTEPSSLLTLSLPAMSSTEPCLYPPQSTLSHVALVPSLPIAPSVDDVVHKDRLGPPRSYPRPPCSNTQASQLSSSLYIAYNPPTHIVDINCARHTQSCWFELTRHDIIFFFHNKTVSAGLSAIETISQTGRYLLHLPLKGPPVSEQSPLCRTAHCHRGCSVPL